MEMAMSKINGHRTLGMLFYVFAMQCISTLAIVYRETGSWRWMTFQLVYMTGLAYALALIVFQGGRMLGWQ